LKIKTKNTKKREYINQRFIKRRQAVIMSFLLFYTKKEKKLAKYCEKWMN
jgi:hypothetical protein